MSTNGAPTRGLEPGTRPALVISECQRGILDPAFSSIPGLAGQAAERGILPKIAVLAARFRELGLPVAHVHIAHNPGGVGLAVTSPLAALGRRGAGMEEGTPPAEPMADVAPVRGDIVSARRSGLAMWYGTDLDALLRNEHVGTLVMTGVSTNVAVFGGSLGAVDRGYQVVIPEDCTAGATPETHQFQITQQLPLLAAMTTSAAVLAALSDRKDHP